MSIPGDPLYPNELYVTWSKETVDAVQRALRHRGPLVVVEREFLPTSDTDSVRVSCVIAARVSKAADGENLALMTNLDGYAMLGDSRRSVFDVPPGPYQDAWRKRLGLPEAGAKK